jgi:hypothetical protein
MTQRLEKRRPRRYITRESSPTTSGSISSAWSCPISSTLLGHVFRDFMKITSQRARCSYAQCNPTITTVTHTTVELAASTY